MSKNETTPIPHLLYFLFLKQLLLLVSRVNVLSYVGYV